MPLKLQENLRVVKLQENLNYISRSLCHVVQPPSSARHGKQSENESEDKSEDVHESEGESKGGGEDESDVQWVCSAGANDWAEAPKQDEAHSAGSLGLMDQLLKQDQQQQTQEQRTTNQQVQTVDSAKASAIKRKATSGGQKKRPQKTQQQERQLDETPRLSSRKRTLSTQGSGRASRARLQPV